MVTPTSNSLYPPDGPQSIGQVLDTGFRVFKISLVRCLLFGAMAMIAGQLPNIYSLVSGQPFIPWWEAEPVRIVLLLVGGVLTVWLCSAMLIRQREIAQGQRRSTRADLQQALRRLPALLGVVAVYLVLVAIVPLALFLSSRAGWNFGSNPIPLALGLAAIAVPILWLLPGLSISMAIAVLTQSGPAASLHQGIVLIMRSWWRTMITFAVWAVLLAVFNFVAVILVMMALPLLGATDIATVSAGTPVVFVALRAIGYPFFVAILLAVYGELQVRKQGVDLQRRVASVAQA